MKRTATVKLKASPMKFSDIPGAVGGIREVLKLLNRKDPIVIAATANIIMQTAADIRLTANLRSAEIH